MAEVADRPNVDPALVKANQEGTANDLLSFKLQGQTRALLELTDAVGSLGVLVNDLTLPERASYLQPTRETQSQQLRLTRVATTLVQLAAGAAQMQNDINGLQEGAAFNFVKSELIDRIVEGLSVDEYGPTPDPDNPTFKDTADMLQWARQNLNVNIPLALDNIASARDSLASQLATTGMLEEDITRGLKLIASLKRSSEPSSNGVAHSNGS